MKIWIFALAVSGVVGACVAGCKDDHTDGSHAQPESEHTSPYPACNEIIESCHEVDVGEGAVHECHDKAHDAKGEGDCTPVKDYCLQICAAAKMDAGVAESEDGGAEDHHHDGG